MTDRPSIETRFTLRRLDPLLLLLLLLVSVSCAQTGGGEAEWDRDAEAASIRQLLEQQQADWNEGDIDAFMTGYWKSEELRFASGGEVRRGWDMTLERYRTTYPDRGAMGRLEFSNLEIDVLSPETALVFGGWRLEREDDAPSGLFTLVIKKLEQDGAVVWRVVADHTSSG